MLLRANAFDRLGRERTTNTEMRWTRIGATRDLSNQERLKDYQSITEENKVLAGRIRDFVAGMPTLETERHEIKQELTQRFSKQAELLNPANIESPPQLSNEKTKGVDQSKSKVRDIER